MTTVMRIVRNVEADVLQVVDARAVHMDRFLLGGFSHTDRCGIRQQRFRGGMFSGSQATPPSAFNDARLNSQLYVVVTA